MPTFFTTFCGIELLEAKKNFLETKNLSRKKNCEQITERTNTIERKLHAAAIQHQDKIHQNYVYGYHTLHLFKLHKRNIKS